MHPLDNAYIRLDRAEEHLKELTSAGVEIVNAEMQSILNSLQMRMRAQPTLELRFWQPLNTIPPKFAVLIGEVIQNLRIALEYLVYELAILDSGNVQPGTQFPIADTEKRERRGATLGSEKSMTPM
jgi:hypothetical protein